MIVTEKEASCIACPFAVSFNASQGRHYMEDGHSKRAFDIATCIGSNCMAWEWTDPPFINPHMYILDEIGEEQLPNSFWGSRLLEGKLGRSSAVWETNEIRRGRIRTEMERRGWKFVEGLGNDEWDARYWRKPNPTRRGQCSRTLTLGD